MFPDRKTTGLTQIGEIETSGSPSKTVFGLRRGGRRRTNGIATELTNSVNGDAFPEWMREEVASKFIDVTPATPTREIWLRLAAIDIQPTDLLQFLSPPGSFPYSRKKLFGTASVEVMAMNWAPEFKCAPHDHGNSYGWIRILTGTASHTIYKMVDGVPEDAFHDDRVKGDSLFAFRGMVHGMGAVGSNPLVTLHAYVPPIVGMKVYDLERCMVCTVSESCGAWWPDDQRQMLAEMKLNRSKSSNTA